MDDYQVEELPKKKIPTYLIFAVCATIINLPLGLLALVFAYESYRCQKYGWKHARRYSDLSFAFSVLGIIVSILLVVLLYAFHHFPEYTYYDRIELIEGATTTTTPAPEGLPLDTTTPAP